ncbi:MAG: V-type ATP synthase subunit D [Candidatus Omnitrophica bacterium 4484_70.2]|nr:MAG: V-type ATP synthase subunit D [Candidatus Omnitrophica bacterium 4484_70.2]
MAKIKLTKNELRRQKEALQRFERYLPTLEIKKQQLQFEINRVDRAIEATLEAIVHLEKEIFRWVDVFAEEVGLEKLFKVRGVKTDIGNIAGVEIPIFKQVEFVEEEYDFLTTPLWVDKAIEVCKKMIVLKAELLVYQKQREILKEELRITTQRINLFEKVKIPQTKENIRVITIYLGDLQTAEVIRGKIAKAKIEERREVVNQ